MGGTGEEGASVSSIVGKGTRDSIGGALRGALGLNVSTGALWLALGTDLLSFYWALGADHLSASQNGTGRFY